MADQTTQDNNRRPLQLVQHQVQGVLPSYFAEEYPRFIQLLEKYYQFNDSQESPAQLIHSLFKSRDLTQVDAELLKYIEDELLLGQSYFGGFSDKRAAAKYSSVLYRSKGSKYSIEQFFRTFFGLDPEVVYTKNNVFIVSESKIGAESQRYLTDDKLYQTYALLIKIGIPIAEWKEVYKIFVHPAGMYVGGEVQIVTSASMFPSLYDDVMPNALTDEDAGLIVMTAEASLFSDPIAYTDISGLYPTDSDGVYRISLNETVSKFADVQVDEANKQYFNIHDLMDANSPTFDEDSDGSGSGIDMSSDLESMDQGLFSYDSA